MITVHRVRLIVGILSKYKGTPKTMLLNNIKRVIDKDEKMINPIILNSLPFDTAFKIFYN